MQLVKLQPTCLLICVYDHCLVFSMEWKHIRSSPPSSNPKEGARTCNSLGGTEGQGRECVDVVIARQELPSKHMP